jgi:hypothetical protein
MNPMIFFTPAVPSIAREIRRGGICDGALC